MITDSLASASATIGGGFFGGLLLGYALKKIVKIVAVVVGLFTAGLVYLQYQQIVPLTGTRLKDYLHRRLEISQVTSQIVIIRPPLHRSTLVFH